MLEERITQLNSSIIELTAALINFVEISQLPKATTKPKTETKKTETKKKETPPKPVPDSTEDVDREKLQNFCLTLVRKDPKNKENIKKVIKEYGGDVLKDVSDNNLPALKAALEAI